MKIIEIKNNFVPKLLNVSAITLWPFIFYADSEPSDEIMFHEWVHVLQIGYHGVVKFYALYVGYYFKLRFKGLKHLKAYYEIPFEKEAYDLQSYFSGHNYEDHIAILENIKKAYYSDS